MPQSLRARITAAAALIVGVVMVLMSIAFAAVLSAEVRDATMRAAETRAQEIALRVDEFGADAVGDLDDDIAQVVDASGRVAAASDDADAGPLPSDRGGEIVSYDGERVLVVTQDLDDDGRGQDDDDDDDGPSREGVIVLAVPVEDDDATLATTGWLLAASSLLVFVVVAGVTWWVVGRALRPVERIRREVDDITADRLDRRVAEPASGDEIAALATTMNRMLERLDASATAQRRFVSDASHELRSPLATMRQHAELARAHPDATTLDDLADVVSDEGLRMQDLVDSLLVLTRLDETALQRRGTVDLDDLALAEASRLRAAGVAVDATKVGAAQVAGDERLLGRVVRNLADNAARHAASRVAFGVRVDGAQAVLTVDDDGTGVPEAERERVFERFVRLDEGRARDAGGSGLGLAIVAGVVRASGGTVAVTDSPLGGARFEVRLPAASD
ncbi:HAMP domain-containing histidine kinase [Microbacterium sp. EYE_5]|nr:HAMP domain-containing sensor histidine kinase [Microbacterium sp. EYE_80]MCK6079472.1 HAMP domain-containing histidine kinase [Microbacterium sp. EYE_382]MCK6084742.1 HAMP domain-containing histidine kinase [Microbacterium sp. EYE_384]MCK6125506.1 HAMP domain-containing histidine kinase [Microbacterium sp. EYE_79]MCK6140426.1 HAMP domain-containing histidine kinase [Microbacterium sp. EYE_39]MCK6217153.1 HAMP domain-containing histidine kinase [Microbacterium sp. EYE_5]MCK6227362.1 HAMP d